MGIARPGRRSRVRRPSILIHLFTALLPLPAYPPALPLFEKPCRPPCFLLLLSLSVFSPVRPEPHHPATEWLNHACTAESKAEIATRKLGSLDGPVLHGLASPGHLRTCRLCNGAKSTVAIHASIILHSRLVTCVFV
jgi:hypothetical protein